MLQRIRKSRATRIVSVYLILNLLAELAAPSAVWALAGGPKQPEFASFTPIGVSDMVDLSSGDFKYNIPLMDVGGYPLNLAYNGSPSNDEEASWVGLGWNLSVGQISRNVRGIPDDFKGDEIKYENNMKPNVTVGAKLSISPAMFGVKILGRKTDSLKLNFGVTVNYNNYSGLSVHPSFGASLEIGNVASVGFNATSGSDGLSIDPTISLHAMTKSTREREDKFSLKIGSSYNSRAGLSELSVTGSYVRKAYKTKTSTGADGEEVQERGGADFKKERNFSRGSTISFVGDTYTPTKRNAMKTMSFSFNASFDGELFGAEVHNAVTGFGTLQNFRDYEKVKYGAAYGYTHTGEADKYGVLDFNREHDGTVSKNTTNIALTNYTYDVYNIQGQGISGMFRPYRSGIGYVYDPLVEDISGSGSLGLEFGAGNLAHVGVTVDATVVNSHSGMWNDNNTLKKYLPNLPTTIRNEHIYYKNVGDLSADNEQNIFAVTGNFQPIQPYIGGNQWARNVTNTYYIKQDNGTAGSVQLSGSQQLTRQKRVGRNQAILSLTKEQVVGANGSVKGVGYGPLSFNAYRTGTAPYVYSDRAPKHHVAEIQVLRNDGAKYVYGLPAYNTKKVEASFATNNEGNKNTGLVGYGEDHNSANNKINDHFFSRTTTPAYAHSYLLTNVLSTDYVDKTGDGPTVDDLGSYTYFEYELKNNNYRWRTPIEANTANYSAGLECDPVDDRANYIYGEKEYYVVKTIKTKTHVAVFTVSSRTDAYGVFDENGGANPDQKSYKLDNIKLYSIADYAAQETNAVPIKTVYFEYAQSANQLCKGLPNAAAGTGKLTLTKVYFTYKNSNMGKYNAYKFNYHPNNPNYNLKSYDSWGNYKENPPLSSLNAITGQPTSLEFPFTPQTKATVDGYVQSWSLQSIELPSGGKIEVALESDDYAYVQNKKAQRAYKVIGVSNGPTDFIENAGYMDLFLSMFTVASLDKTDYLCVDLSDVENIDAMGLAGKSPSELYQLFFKDNDKLMFRFFLNMTRHGAANNPIPSNSKFEYVSGYATVLSDGMEYKNSGGRKYLKVKIKKENISKALNLEFNPISLAGWNFGRKYHSKLIYTGMLLTNGYDQGAKGQIEQAIKELLNFSVPAIARNIAEAVTGPNIRLRDDLIACRFVTSKSWVRMNVITGKKYGGGARVKQVRISDEWSSMTSPAAGYETMKYGQEYDYTLLDGTSSGVATYEPIGNKENPWVQPVFTTTKHLLAPDDNNYDEEPFGESFFPSPTITYARVTVKNLQGSTTNALNVKQLHKTGKVVSEFYTSKDFPTRTSRTRLDLHNDKKPLILTLLKFYSTKSLTASQGYMVHLNDMNGKSKGQQVYAEGQITPISSVEYRYKLQENGELDNNLTVINSSGDIKTKMMGVEYDIVNDFRENATSTKIVGIDFNTATFLFGFPIVIPVPLPSFSLSDDKFNSVSTTKVINSFGILEETIAREDGAAVSTKNLAWDEKTGEVLVTQTVDEFNENYYSFNMPAHWYYKGMGQAAFNLGMAGKLTDASASAGAGAYNLDGVVAAIGNYIIPGDELIYKDDTGAYQYAWVTSLQGSTNSFKLIDKNGAALTSLGGKTFQIFRSGARNLQSGGVMNATLMRNPLRSTSGATLANLGAGFLTATNFEQWRIINAGAVDYSDNWPADCECGNAATSNPYRNNSKGVWRTRSSRTYLTGRNYQAQVTPRRQGFFNKFSPMYKLTPGVGWGMDQTNWTFVSSVNKFSPYGFELENKDALNRYSGAQYGYNNRFPVAVGANTRYQEIGAENFEEKDFFSACPSDAHFGFRESTHTTGYSTSQAHSGKSSYKVVGNTTAEFTKRIKCPITAQP